VDDINHAFVPSKKCLFFSDVKSKTADFMVNRVAIIKNRYTDEEYSDAHKVWSIQDTIGRPIMIDYIDYIERV